MQRPSPAVLPETVLTHWRSEAAPGDNGQAAGRLRPVRVEGSSCACKPAARPALGIGVRGPSSSSLPPTSCAHARGFESRRLPAPGGVLCLRPAESGPAVGVLQGHLRCPPSCTPGLPHPLPLSGAVAGVGPLPFPALCCVHPAVRPDGGQGSSLSCVRCSLAGTSRWRWSHVPGECPSSQLPVSGPH